MNLLSFFEQGLRLLLLCTVLVALQTRTFAQHSPPSVGRIQIGFNGKFKLGHFTPVRITLRGGDNPVSGTVRLAVADGDAVTSVIAANDGQPIVIAAGEELTVIGYAMIGRRHSDVRVSLVADDGIELAHRTSGVATAEAILATQRLVVTVGSSIGIDDAIRRRLRNPLEQVFATRVENAEHLPEDELGYDGVDLLVLTTNQFDRLDQLGGTKSQAIEQWVAHKGRILICAGVNGALAFDRLGPVSSMLPGQFEGIVDSGEASPLESFSGSTQTLPFRVNDQGRALSSISHVAGDTLVSTTIGGNDIPILVRSPWGFGQVMFCGVDLDAGAFARWPDQGLLAARLLDVMLGDAEEFQELRGGQVRHVGYEDLSGQLRAALDQFPSVAFISFRFVVFLAACYIALIGPVDYFVLNRFIRRAGYTWLTFPLVVTLFALIPFGLVHSWKASANRLNQVELIDVDLTKQQIRGSAFIHIYSPDTASYDLSATPQPAIAASTEQVKTLLTWHGLAGTGFGGMDSVDTGRGSQSYEMVWQGRPSGTRSLSLERFPIVVNSTRSLRGVWNSVLTTHVPSTLVKRRRDNSLRGEFRNPLTVTLEDCWLAFDRWVYRINRLEPNEPVQWEGRRPQTLDWLLARRGFDSESKERTTPWNAQDTDVRRIVEMMTFHDRAGGAAYTQLLNRQEGFLELTDQLTIGRAVFIGRAAQRATRMYVNGATLPHAQQSNSTFYRFVIPLEIQ